MTLVINKTILEKGGISKYGYSLSLKNICRDNFWTLMYFLDVLHDDRTFALENQEQISLKHVC